MYANIVDTRSWMQCDYGEKYIITTFFSILNLLYCACTWTVHENGSQFGTPDNVNIVVYYYGEYDKL